MVCAVGVLLGLVVAAITAVALPPALRQAGSQVPVTFPWATMTGVVLATMALGLATSAAAGVTAIRVRPTEGIGIPE